jgi:molecular chaperone HtpG
LKPVLEVNPKHPLIATLSAKLDDTALIADAAATLLNLALVQEGDVPTDPTAFARRVTLMLASSLG